MGTVMTKTVKKKPKKQQQTCGVYVPLGLGEGSENEQ